MWNKHIVVLCMLVGCSDGTGGPYYHPDMPDASAGSGGSTFAKSSFAGSAGIGTGGEGKFNLGGSAGQESYESHHRGGAATSTGGNVGRGGSSTGKGGSAPNAHGGSVGVGGTTSTGGHGVAGSSGAGAGPNNICRDGLWLCLEYTTGPTSICSCFDHNGAISGYLSKCAKADYQCCYAYEQSTEFNGITTCQSFCTCSSTTLVDIDSASCAAVVKTINDYNSNSLARVVSYCP